MKIIVVGAGIIGVSTAHYLQRAGASVTLLDANLGPAEATSRGNAGSMTASRAFPWASIKTIVKAVGSYFDADSAFKLALQADPAQWRWLWGFARSACNGRGALKRRAMIELALATLRERAALDAEFGLRYGGVYPKLLTVFSDKADLRAAIADLTVLADLGVRARAVSAADCTDLEPSVDWSRRGIAGGVLAEDDVTADCHRFCAELDRVNRRLGVDARYGTRVRALDAARLGACRVDTPDGPLRADAVVLAAGVESALLARTQGVTLPIYPVKGYSLTVPMPAHARPRLTIAYEARKVFLSPMEDGVRAAGIADLGAFDPGEDRARSEQVRRAIRELLPDALLDAAPTAWAGLRPMTHDGPPVICGVPGSGLWINTGHGALGWSMSLGSARLIAAMVMARRHESDQPWFGLRHR